MLSARIKGLRKKHGESQQALADAIGTSQRMVSNWEQEVNNPPLDMILSMADHYGVTTDYLLGRSPSPDIYAQSVGEIDGQAATLLTTRKEPLSDADKAVVVASAQAPGAVVIDTNALDLPKSREELEAFVLRLIESAKQHEH